LTFDAGLVVPVFVDEVLPGDTFNLKTNMFVRLLSPMPAPIMDDMFLDIQYFYVPTRILWDNWKRFQGEQPNPGDSTDFTVPTVAVQLNTTAAPPGPGLLPFQPGSIFDCMGISPVSPSQAVTPPVPVINVNVLPFRAYNLIWNEWYRDENLQVRAPENRGDSGDVQTDFWIHYRGKRHDYFTSCLPWPQKGPGVELPIVGGSVLPVTGQISIATIPSQGGAQFSMQTSDSSTGVYDSSFLKLDPASGGVPDSVSPLVFNIPSGGSPGGANMLSVDTSSGGSVAITINSLREAVQLQRLLERDARGGTRYTEMLLAHFGVTSPDASLQRPEYLGGMSSPISINTVAQTSSTDSASPQANLAAYAVAASSRGSGFVKSFTEHGYVLGLASVRANLTYQQGINRMWFRKTRYDFYMPVLAHLGEQAVLNQEIFVTATPSDSAVFGYQERFAEYRYAPSRISGWLRSQLPTPLDVWHLSQYFESAPALNADFIAEKPPIPRVSAVSRYQNSQFIGDFYFDCKCVRVMPTYSVPGLMDHF
jgi:hypothetical protein